MPYLSPLASLTCIVLGPRTFTVGPLIAVGLWQDYTKMQVGTCCAHFAAKNRFSIPFLLAGQVPACGAWCSATFKNIASTDSKRPTLWQVTLFERYREKDEPFAIFVCKLHGRAGGGLPPPVAKAWMHIRLHLGMIRRMLYWVRVLFFAVTCGNSLKVMCHDIGLPTHTTVAAQGKTSASK